MGNAFAACQTCSILQCDACAEVLPTLLNSGRGPQANDHLATQSNTAQRNAYAGQDFQPTNMSDADLMRLAQQRSLAEAGIAPSPEEAAHLQRIASNGHSPSPMSGGSSPLRGHDSRSEEELLATAIRASEQEDRRDLRESQTREYEESLAIDRQRQEERRQREQQEEQRVREAEEAEERRCREEKEAVMRAKEAEDAFKARISNIIEEARGRLLEEPTTDEPGRVVVRVRTPEGKALKRAFRSADLISQVYDFTLSEGGEDLASQEFRLIATMPRAVYENRNETLDAAGLQGQCALLVEIIEPDE